MTPISTRSRRNYLSLVSLAAGVASMLMALIAYTPIPLVSLLSFPLGLCAMTAGWAGARRARAAGDAVGAAQARWGVRLGCLAWLVEGMAGLIFVTVVGGLLWAALAAWRSPP